ncbi:DUF1740-domain-containing protein [Periconia macrospinosa]|uniref:DUF1740-domain-containing protein n=1 Tax=Periconia macrospinosa TaxID=97972 RepID=A0A2V1DHT3_9PLEO|nr:DUF1740-domain-containing protein [Periconia macrospinosa]
MDRNVPKFTSFRPKLKPKPPEPVETPPQPKKHKPHREYQGKSHSESFRKHQELPKERGTEHRKETNRQAPQPSNRQYDGTSFFSDRRGDPDIEKYGTVNRYEVPRYHSIGYGYVLGLPLDRKIDRNLSTDKTVVITPSTSSQGKRVLTDRHALKQHHVKTIKFIKTAADEDSLNADFIALSRGSKRKRSDLDGDDADDEEGDKLSEGIADYRQLDSCASGNKPSDPDAEYESDTVIAADSELAKRNAALQRQTREHPEDLDGWLNLIKHQEAMVMADHISELTPSDKIHLATVRMSIYEQALRKFDSDESSQAKLYGGFMSEASLVWDSSRRANKWAEILKKFPLSTDLWILYLNDVQSSWATFTYDKCRDAFLDCLRTLKSGGSLVQSDFVLYILVRLTSMIHQAGYYKMAVGIWQAVLEFTLLKPRANLDQSPTENLQSFEEFWDSDVARVGEEGATGWFNFELGSTPKFPERSTDEVDENDVLNIVLFSDIEEILKSLPRAINALSLLNAFLNFCQLPPITQENNVQRYQLDPFLQDTFVEEVPYKHEESYVFPQVLARYSGCPLRKYQATTELLFQNVFPQQPRVVDALFIRRVFELLAVDISADEFIGVYLIALESNYFPSKAFKTAKRLLKARPTNLYLYNAYALAEDKHNNSLKAEQVFSTALSMPQQQPDQLPLSTPGSLDLFSNWVWQGVRKGDHLSGLWRLTVPTGQLPKYEEEPPPQAAILRTRNLLSEITSRALIGEDYARAVTSTSLLALLNYLSQPSTIHAALSVHSSLSEHFKTHPNLSAQELQAQSIAALLTHHTIYALRLPGRSQGQKDIVKPSLLRHTLEPLIQQFPSNTILLSLYATNEARFPLENRVRDLFTNLRSENDVVSSAFAMHHERLRAHITAVTAAPTAAAAAENHDSYQRIHPQPYAMRAVFTSVANSFPHCPAVRQAHAQFEFAHFKSLDQLAKAKNTVPTDREIDSENFATLHPHTEKKRIRTDRPMMKQDRQRLREVYASGLTKLPWHKGYMLLGLEIARLLESSDVGRDKGRKWDSKEDGLNISFDKIMFEKGLTNGDYA